LGNSSPLTRSELARHINTLSLEDDNIKVEEFGHPSGILLPDSTHFLSLGVLEPFATKSLCVSAQAGLPHC
jgi:hypothetical protein